MNQKKYILENYKKPNFELEKELDFLIWKSQLAMVKRAKDTFSITEDELIKLCEGKLEEENA